jgi:CheY-like chemotaxis protein/HPt (histidine-containing phosphotransfer) domain-containing protein
MADESAAVARAKSEFLALLGHELRTPVSAVVGSVDLLRAMPLPQDVREVVDGVHRSTGLLQAMIDDLLDLARLQTGHLDLDERPVVLAALFDEVIEPLQQRARDKGLLLLAGTAPDLPETITADAGRLRQVLTSVIGNAVKFTERGEVVATAAPEKAGWMLITVSDTGPGVAGADSERIFAPFVQADASAARRHEGAGVGLALAARLTERMGGSITMTSEVDRGSEFYVRLPLVPAGASDDERTRPSGMRVGLAAPSPRSGLVLGWMLAATGADVVPTTLGAVVRRPPTVDAVVWCDDSHDAAATRRADAVLAALPATCRVIMISTTDPRRGLVRGPALITSPLTRARLAAVLHQERTGTRGAPVMVAPLPAGRVLLAEDNDVNRTVFRRMIALLGVEVDAVADGAEAVAAVLGRDDYSIVLMDMQMPGVDGLEATRRLRAAGVRVPIVALTATALRGDRDRCLAAGMDGYLSKPIKLADLREALASYLTPATAQVVDVTQLHELEDQLADPVLVAKTIMTYLDQLGTRRAAFADALRHDDRDAVRAAAHTLKSASALLGAASLAAACATVEQRASSADPEQLAGLIAEVDAGAVAAAAALAEYVGGADPADTIGGADPADTIGGADPADTIGGADPADTERDADGGLNRA